MPVPEPSGPFDRRQSLQERKPSVPSWTRIVRCPWHAKKFALATPARPLSGHHHCQGFGEAPPQQNLAGKSNPDAGRLPLSTKNTLCNPESNAFCKLDTQFTIFSITKEYAAPHPPFAPPSLILWPVVPFADVMDRVPRGGDSLTL